MKKIISLLLAFVMLFSMATMVFAAEAESGSITINGASARNTYTIYKLLDLESYDVESGAYSYKVNSAWTDFFKESTGALNYITLDEAGYVTWKAAEDDDTVAAFAKLALGYAKDHDFQPIKSTEDEDDYTKVGDSIKFENLELGYYLVDSTMGALCGLTTTNPDASINAKNAAPTIDKQVQEDSTSQWGGQNTADIGQTVSFRVTINVHAGAENYVLHDKMSDGLTFKEVTRIEHVIPDVKTEEATKGEHYTVVTDDLTDGCTFEVQFIQSFCDHLETNDKVVVYYEAMLNRNAIVAGDGNHNKAWLDYGENHHTTYGTTTTYTFGFDIVKTDSQNKLIDGAEFRIYDAAEGGNEIAVVLLEGDANDSVYRRARADEDDDVSSIVVKDGKVRVVGFDNGTYYLEETVSPAGYNKLTSRQKFIISDGNLDAVFNNGIFSTGSGVHVINKTGEMLPETGGTGTAMFIAFGIVVVIATGLLLVTKRRMSKIVD